MRGSDANRRGRQVHHRRRRRVSAQMRTNGLTLMARRHADEAAQAEELTVLLRRMLTHK